MNSPVSVAGEFGASFPSRRLLLRRYFENGVPEKLHQFRQSLFGYPFIVAVRAAAGSEIIGVADGPNP